MTKKLALGMTISLVFIFIGIPGCDRAEESVAQASDKKNQKDERLIGKLGIIKVPHASVPVEITLPDLDGHMVRISDFRGKVVFLNFWTTWCPSCRVEMPSMERLHRRFKDKGFVMVAINLQESRKQVKGFFRKQDLTFMSLLDKDGKVGTRFGIRNIPTTYILDKKGKILGAAMGAREWDSKEAIELFEHLINTG